MSRKRRNHLPQFKAKVALAAVKGDKTISELAQKFDVHPNQISTWKNELLDKVESLFTASSEKKKNTSDEVDKLQ